MTELETKAWADLFPLEPPGLSVTCWRDAHGRRYELYRDPATAGEVASLIAEAREELAAGEPAFALHHAHRDLQSVGVYERSWSD